MLLVRDTLSAAGLCNQLGMEESSAQGSRSRKEPKVRLAWAPARVGPLPTVASDATMSRVFLNSVCPPWGMEQGLCTVTGSPWMGSLRHTHKGRTQPPPTPDLVVKGPLRPGAGG